MFVNELLATKIDVFQTKLYRFISFQLLYDVFMKLGAHESRYGIHA
jgi:hypothetical protein